MTTAAATSRPATLMRNSAWDALLVALAGAHAVALVVWPSLGVVAIGLWWNSNTISHAFLHTPFFRSRVLNAAFSLFETALVGIPQTIWRQRHLAHHAGLPWRLHWSRLVGVEIMLVLIVWTTLATLALDFFLRGYFPGMLLGLTLCALHGHFEHAGGTVSHYGAAYNWLFFNDGYHVEHHSNPGLHWTRLPAAADNRATLSRWPPVLRWLDVLSLEGLERLVLRWGWLQSWVLRVHERAFRRILPFAPGLKRAAIVGGGLFPRTALLLRRLVPDAELVVIDRNVANLETARRLLDDRVQFVHAAYEPVQCCDVELVVFPLSFVGDRRVRYDVSAAPAVLVHDWIWNRRGRGAIVSWLLLKRLNLVRRCGD